MPIHTLSRRRFLQLTGAAGALTAATLTGCQPSKTSNDNAIMFTSWTFGSETVGPPLREILTGYGKTNNVTVTENTYPYLQYLDQLVLKAKSKNISGVAHIDEEWMSTLVELGALAAAPSTFDATVYAKPVQAGGSYKDTRYATPWTQSAIGMIGNSELLSGVGATDAPKTIDQFTDLLRKLKKSDTNLVPYAPATDVKQVKDMIPWMWAFGATIVQDGKVTLGDTGSIAALNYWKSLLDEGLIQPGVVRDDARTLFAQGRTAIYDDAPQAISIIPGQSPDKKIAAKMTPLSRPVNDPHLTGASLVWSQPLVAFGEQKPYWDLAGFMSTDEASLEKMFKAGGQPPTTTTALNSSWFTSNEFQTNWNNIVSTTAVRNPFWSFPSATAAQTTFNEHVERALRGTDSAETAMAEAAADLQSQLSSK